MYIQYRSPASNFNKHKLDLAFNDKGNWLQVQLINEKLLEPYPIFICLVPIAALDVKYSWKTVVTRLISNLDCQFDTQRETCKGFGTKENPLESLKYFFYES